MKFEISVHGSTPGTRKILIKHECRIVGVIEKDADGDVICLNKIDRKYLTKENLDFLLAYLQKLRDCANDFDTVWFKETVKK